MNLNEAARVLQALEPAALLFAEEPLPYEDIDGYAELRQRTTTPIAGGEMLAGLHEFRAFLEADALDIVQPDVSFCGGITTDLGGDEARVRPFVRTALHMGGSFGPAYAAGLHLSFAHKDAIILETLPVALPTIREVLSSRWSSSTGRSGRRRRMCPGWAWSSTEAYLRKYPFVPGSGRGDSAARLACKRALIRARLAR